MTRAHIPIAIACLAAVAGCKVLGPKAPKPDYVQFDTNKSEPTSAAGATVDSAVARLTKDTSLHVLIVGHTDSSGSADYNQKLSLRRAEGIRGRLVAAGIADKRVEFAARGESEPLEGDDTAAARARNRRVELFYFYPSSGSAKDQYGFDLVFGTK